MRASDQGKRGPGESAPGYVGSAYAAERLARNVRARPREWASSDTPLGVIVGRPHVFITGEDAADRITAWATSGELPEGWGVGTFYADDRAPVLTLEGEAGRTRISCADQWTRKPTTPAVAERAWSWLAQSVAHHFRGGVLLDSPASTGRDLLARSLPAGVRYSCQPADVADEIRASSGQHRMEQLAPEGTELPGMVELDLRLAYAACSRGVPWGWPERMTGEPAEWDPWRPARYYGCWTVPEGWDHVGLLPMQLAGGKWSWPSEPGAPGVGWLDYRELALARRYGWEVTVTESIVWPGRRSDPLRTWAKHLATIAQEAEGAPMPDAAREAAAAGARAILLHGIGALHGQARRVSYSCPASEPGRVPEGAEAVELKGDRIVWHQRTAPAWPNMVHPEWTSSVWAAARTLVLDGRGPGGVRLGALHLPRRDVIGIRGDAIYATADPGWPDDGQPGRFRPKGRLGPFTMPRSLVALDQLRGAGVQDAMTRARAALKRG